MTEELTPVSPVDIEQQERHWEHREREQNHARLRNIRTHAATIQSLIESEFASDLLNTRIYRALYVSDGTMIAAAIYQIKGGNPPLFVQIQTRFAETAPIPAAQQLQGSALTPTEIAVFLGLDHVEPDGIAWVEQKFDTRGLALVRSSLPELTGRK